jgi:hypothetical protein
MDRLLILMGLKKPPASEFPPLPPNDDSPNSKGLTQFFNIKLNGVLNDDDSGETCKPGIDQWARTGRYIQVQLRIYFQISINNRSYL